MSKIDQLFSENPHATAFAKGYLEYLGEILAQMDVSAIAGFAEIVLKARERGARIFFIGNGGSAATASHFANDFGAGSRSWEKPFRAVSLTDNLATLTAIANDYGYDEIFTRQLQMLMLPGDIVVAISASGNSKNVVKAVEYANLNGATTVVLTGFDGGELKRIGHLGIHVPTNKGEYGPVEDAHMIIDHMVGAFLMNTCLQERADKE